MKVSRVRALVVVGVLGVIAAASACNPQPAPGPTAPPGPNGPLVAAPGGVSSMTSDGKKLAVSSSVTPIRVWDRTANTTTPVTDTVPSTTGIGLRNGPVISGNGSKVAWTGYFHTNGSIDGKPRYGVTPVVYDRTTGVTKSLPTAGIPTDVDFADIAMPDDGSFLAVERKSSISDDLTVELVIWNLVTDQVTSTGLTAVQTYTSSGQVSVSDNGRYVQFERSVWDRQTNQVTALSLPGAQGYDNAGLSGNGRYFAFNSRPDSNYHSYRPSVWDRQTNTFKSAPLGFDGQPLNDQTYVSAISDDGATAVVASAATNVVAGDTNGQFDTFVWNLKTNTFRRLLGPGGVEPNGSVYGTVISGNAKVIAGTSNATNIGVNGSFVWTE